MGGSSGDSLIRALQNPALYQHPVIHFQIIETHLSWVLLTGVYAYKIKKPVNLGFADFSSLDKRHHFCLEELRLNKILAPDLYIEVLPIRGTVQHPVLLGQGQPIEYAVKLREFEQKNLLSNLVKKSVLNSKILRDIATQIAHFHATAPVAPIHSVFGTADYIQKTVLDNFSECRHRLQDATSLKKLSAIEDWSLMAFEENKSLITYRKENGFIKECHGDLHLGNMVLINDAVTIFDCIEFNLGFRCIDVIDEVAFLVMDLQAKSQDEDAYRFLNHYLELTGDYEGLPLLRFYMIYRAMVRAKIALLSEPPALDSFEQYLDLAFQMTKTHSPKLMITHGLPGSGKTFVTRELAPYVSAIYIRSDCERKRLFGNIQGQQPYSDLNTETTYQKLFQLSKTLLAAGYNVIVDATFIKQKHRDIFQKLAEILKISFIILHCEATVKTAFARVSTRSRKKQDASDANAKVLNQFIEKQELLTTEALKYTYTLQTDTPIDFEALARQDIFR